ncbi:hypothetical protein SAMN02745150_01046 [Brevinema andersonii]|uniref:Uncharacterized protein n=1 Tax=Brevinema andersonii TaxID=34097 RepID=A0A1I1EBK9_BREAD|nr:hypothetical protein [Brevinema andersonii]SFB84427.1 hypothetical protein SAMN02745150_01046 [Brevinema andersonii]
MKGYHTVVDFGIKKLLIYDKGKLKQSKVDLSKYDKIVDVEIKAPIIGYVWNMQFINPVSQERLGYQTQKLIALFGKDY